jgi:hypothetical protein
MSFVQSIAKKGTSRIVIYPKDVEILTGKKNRTACTTLQNIRKALGKAKHQVITITEFCCYMGMDERLVREFLSD